MTEHDANEIAKELKDRCEELCPSVALLEPLFFFDRNQGSTLPTARQELGDMPRIFVDI